MGKLSISRWIATALLATPFLAAASTNLITNGSFEANAQANTTWNIYNNLTGWTGGRGGIELRNNVAGKAYEGKNYVELDTWTNSSMSQSFNSLLGQSYVLSFAYSPREHVAASSNGIQVLWNGADLGTFTGTAAASGNVWEVETLNVFGTGGLTTLSFKAVGRSDSYGGSLDSVSVTTAIPEPETYALMVAGLGLMALVARRRKA
jgi:Protein of unknown function (DUF642)/PEP-CTERM motif